MSTRLRSVVPPVNTNGSSNFENLLPGVLLGLLLLGEVAALAMRRIFARSEFDLIGRGLDNIFYFYFSLSF
jgi:hypothetical protein